MALKVKAVERLVKFKKNEPGQYRYVMQPELYTSLSQNKVIKEAALRSGVSRGVMQACWDAAGEVIKAWATEGHSVALPGLGTMRFPEGRAGRHRRADHLLRPRRQGGEARDFNRPGHHRGSRERGERWQHREWKRLRGW